MKKITLPSTAILGAMLALLLNAAPAQAQSKTWVSSTGSGSHVHPRGTVRDLPGGAHCDRRRGRDQLRRCW